MMPPACDSTTGLLLGAGASYEAGLPLVWDLTAELKRWLTPKKLRELNTTWEANGGTFTKDVIEQFARALQHSEMHYESLIGFLEVHAMQAERGTAVHQGFEWLRLFVADLIYYFLLTRHVQNVEYIDAGLRYLDGVAGLAEQNMPLWIFSLNHDLIVESLAARHGMHVSAGLVDHTSIPLRDAARNIVGSLRAEILTREDFSSHGLRFLPAGAAGINLLKIHGGLDLFTINDRRDIIRIVSSDSTAAGVIEAVRAVNEEIHVRRPDTGRPVRTFNEILYYDANEKIQMLRRSLLAGAFKFDSRYEQPIPAEFLGIFKRNIEVVGRLICIGYGFGDAHVNEVVRGWLEGLESRRLTIVDPFRVDVPPSLLHVAPQINLCAASAADYLALYAEHPLTEQEYRLKERRSIERVRKREVEGFA